MKRPWLRSLLAASLLSIFFLPLSSHAGDWLIWRRPEQNGVSRETSLPGTWDPDTGENLVWKVPVGGQGTPIINGNRLYTLTRVGEVKAPGTVTAGTETQEALVCVDTKTGELLWKHSYNMTQTNVPFWHVGWSNPAGDAETGNVYALGTQCTLICLDGKTGKAIWERQLTEEFGMISTFGGRTPSPTIDGDLVILAGVSFGWGDNARGTHRIYAFNKKTGELVWTNGVPGIPVDAGYNTPIITTLNGMRIVMFAAGDGSVDAYKVNTGERIWSYPISKRGMNASLVMDGTKVYVCSDLDNFNVVKLGSVVCLDFGEMVDGKPKLVWRVYGIEAGYGSPTIFDGRLYVVDNKSTIFAMDAATGKTAWKKNLGTIGKGSLLFADGKIYVPEANGKVFILQPGDKDCKVLSKVEIPEKFGREYATYGQMAVAHGRVYLQSATTLYSIGFKTPNEVGEGKIPPAAAAEKGEGPVAFVQVTPADVVTHPGEKINFTVKTFDAKGRFLAEVKDAEWSIGQLNAPVVPKTGPATPPSSAPAATKAAADAQLLNYTGSTVVISGSHSITVTSTAPAPATSTAPATTSAGAPVPPAKIGNLKGSVAAGVFTAAAGPPQGGGVFAKVGNVTGFARVRVMPPTPWKFDFESTPDGVPPLTWTGAGGKFAVRTLNEGQGVMNKVLVKLTNVPLYDRARTNFGTPDMTEYTLQADIQATTHVLADGGTEMPDAGIINQRYVLVLMGNDQKAQINVWATMLPYSINKTIPFKWEANKWYTFKLRVEQLEKTAKVYGKIWAKGTPEPEAWTLDLEDKIPNRSGNPGLFAYSFKSLEIFYDNVLLTPNK